MNAIALHAARSLLSEHGPHETWLAGQSARSALGTGSPDSPLLELLSTAEAAACERVGAAVRGLAPGLELVHIEPLAGRTLEQALRERGLPADAIAIAADTAVIDPFEGRAQLEQGVIRTIEAPDRAFRRQPELLLRVARLIAWTPLRPSSELHRLATRDAGNILDVTDRPRHWGLELNKLLLGPDVDPALDWLESSRTLRLLLPEVAAMVGFDRTCAVHHKDIWEHTRIVSGKAAPQLVVRWAALGHDIGKIWTRTVNKARKVHFFRHEEHGALLFEGIAHRVGLDADLTGRAAYLIRNHSRVNLYEQEWTDSAVRRLIRDTDGHLHDLITFSRADYTTKNEARIRQMQRALDELEDRVRQIRELDARVPPLQKGIGAAIIDRFGLQPSRLIGRLKTQLEEAIEAGDLPERSEDAVYLAWLESHAAEEITAAGGVI